MIRIFTIVTVALSIFACRGTDDGDPPPYDDMDDDGWTIEDGDCNDEDPMIFPFAEELCDRIDNDCDTLTDQVTTAPDFSIVPLFETHCEVMSGGLGIRECINGTWGPCLA